MGRIPARAMMIPMSSSLLQFTSRAVKVSNEEDALLMLDITAKLMAGTSEKGIIPCGGETF